MSQVVVVDYGLGNILSVTRALTVNGADVELSSDPQRISQSERIVIPGVGAFADGMKGLQERGLVEPLREYAKSGRPMLGICLGMQLLFATAKEFGEHKGLGIVPGRVVPIPDTGPDGSPHKIPHVGWNSLETFHDRSALLEGLGKRPYFYFVHSFSAIPESESTCVASTTYNGQKITAVVQKDRVYGCQFHPEKSGTVGLGFLQNFLERA